MNNHDPLMNSNNVPTRQRDLFDAFSKSANGHSAEDVAGAAINLFLNAIRQSNKTASSAERAFDEAMGRAKFMLLAQHYHGNGERKNVFPFTQNIEVGPPGWSKNTLLRR